MNEERPFSGPVSVGLAGLSLLVLAAASFTSALTHQLHLPKFDAAAANATVVIVPPKAAAAPPGAEALAYMAPPAPPLAAKAPTPHRPRPAPPALAAPAPPVAIVVPPAQAEAAPAAGTDAASVVSLPTEPLTQPEGEAEPASPP